MDERRQLERAEQVRKCAEAYMDVARRMQAELVRLARIKNTTGEFPANAKERLGKLQREGKMLSVRMLRLRADMIEASLDTFEGTEIPDILPDELPENW